VNEPAKAPFVAPVRAFNMIWLAVVAGVAWAANHCGTPHLRTHYVWSGTRAAPTYHECRYWGLHSFRVRPRNGTCPLFVMAQGRKDGR